jgi:hypothetical protein
VQVQWRTDFLLPLDLLHSTLAEPQVAIALLRRASVPRRDFIRLEPQFAADQPRKMIPNIVPDDDSWWRDDLVQQRIEIENAAKTAAPVAPAPAP